MHVCFLNHDLKDSTGAGRFGLSLIGRLLRRRPDLGISVLTSVGCNHPWEQVILPQSKLGFLLRWRKVRKALRRADIIHALDVFPYGFLALLAAVGLRKKIIITAIGTGAIQPLYRWYGPILYWVYRRADALVAISRYTRREILKKVPGVAIEVINHAVDVEEFKSGLWHDVEPRYRREIEKLNPYIFSVGSAKSRKGFEYSIRAFHLLLRSFPSLNYLILGTGGVTVEYVVRELKLEEKVVFIRRVSRPVLTAMYRNAKLFILLPHEVDKDVEGFGFVFLEAAAAGLPVIGTYESGAEDAVWNGHNGFLVRPRDPEAAAEAALKILGSPELRHEFSKNSLKFAERMNWSRVAEKYLELYAKLLSPEKS